MATTIQTFPVEYLNAIDEVLVGATYAHRYDTEGTKFVSGRQVSVPSISFGDSPDPINYNKFATVGDVSITRQIYTLDNDKEKSFYIDAVDAMDEPAAQMTQIVSEYQRTILGPFIDKDFFAKAKARAMTTATAAIDETNVKSVIRAARTQFTNAGLSGGELYVTSDVLGALEDATDRQWSNETSILDTVGSYDGFQVFEVPDDVLGSDLIAISGGSATIHYVVKRAAAYTFAPGQHTSGDGWLQQMRWVFGTIVTNNKRPGIFASKHTA